jgi:flagellar biogenesis protein FliO
MISLYSPATFLIMLLALLAFGLAYNWLVARAERAVPDHGYTAVWVIGGVLITVLATIPLIGWQNALTVLAAFGASGLVMTLGSILLLQVANELAIQNDHLEAMEAIRREQKGEE